MMFSFCELLSERAVASGQYVGRFAPSPTGPLHVGSVVAALASWLDARAAAAQGLPSTWLVRIEDVDSQRCSPAAAHTIVRQLQLLGLHADGPIVWQSQRDAVYASALQHLQRSQLAYACRCTRKDIETAWLAKGVTKARFQTLIYPGTCRHAVAVEPVRAWRFALPEPDCTLVTEGEPGALAKLQTQAVQWHDRRLGLQSQNVCQEVGDFVLLRADGAWSYQLACVVDDALQGVTHIVRGEDLCDNTARQLLLQQALGLPAPQYLHVPLARDARGEKLSKGNHAPSIDESVPQRSLLAAAHVLGLPTQGQSEAQAPAQLLAPWVAAWAARYPLKPPGAPLR
ncbi:tRNA glutamyl-Q(34) synthetase GluQRS [Lampropedia aestuarii]|nr:tRNA glutamyl-Q(34) synthetase GluQRS [Lampropedia aestuarii]MDH5857944.1 tRNA glutamyl-Q(34) synthetase GluQRS [Lampropedia aestuarii]